MNKRNLIPFFYCDIFISSSIVYPLTMYDLHTSGLKNQNASGSHASRGTRNYGPEHYTDTQRWASLNLWLAECQDHRQIQRRTKCKGYTPNPRTEIKIPDPAWNRTRAAGMEGMDPTDHATATDKVILPIKKLITHQLE